MNLSVSWPDGGLVQSWPTLHGNFKTGRAKQHRNKNAFHVTACSEDSETAERGRLAYLIWHPAFLSSTPCQGFEDLTNLDGRQLTI